MFDRTEAKTSAEIEYTPTLIHSELVSSYPSIAALHLPDVLHNIIPFSLPFLQDFLLNILQVLSTPVLSLPSLPPRFLLLSIPASHNNVSSHEGLYGQRKIWSSSLLLSIVSFLLLLSNLLAVMSKFPRYLSLSASIVDMSAKTRSKNSTLGVEINPTKTTIKMAKPLRSDNTNPTKDNSILLEIFA